MDVNRINIPFKFVFLCCFFILILTVKVLSVAITIQNIGDPCKIHDGSPGICRPPEACKWILDNLNKSLRPSDIQICGYRELDSIACCKTEDSNTTTSAEVPVVSQRAANACEAYVENSDLLDKIRGGGQANVGEFPHMVALFRASDDAGQNLNFLCGGSIISELFILTAAHCANFRRDSDNPRIVRIGNINISANVDYFDRTDYEIEHIFLHPKYNSTNNHNDIALLKLKGEITFSASSYPACLQTDLADLNSSVPLIATGWGRTEHDASSDILLKVDLMTVSLASCNRTLLRRNELTPTRKYAAGLNVGQYCAHDPNAIKDTCDGDSGGPLQIAYKKGLSKIVGLTSFGELCGSKYPSIYTRVANYIGWIESIVSDWQKITDP